MLSFVRLGLASIALAVGPVAAFAGANAPQPVAVFPIELWDTSGEGLKPGQADRLQHATDTLANSLEKTGKYSLVSLAPYKEAVAKTEPRYNCNGCWRPIAKEAGAQLAVLSTIHKISSLISSFDISIINVETGKLVDYASGQFRGDTDEAYTRSIAFLVKERLLNAEAEGAAAPRP